MKIGSTLTTTVAIGAAIGAGLLSANAIPGGKGGGTAGSIGADVAVCDLPAIYRWGMVSGITAYSVGTTSVNLGDVDLEWYANTNRHPRIPQNAFKFDRGRLIQIGQSWCKDGFCALQQNQCGSCDPAGSGCPQLLGPGCSDPYSSSINGDQSGLAPRSQCNPATGFYEFPPTNLPAAAPTLGRRLQIKTIELNPNATTDDARFYVDAFYLHIQDYEAGNELNNGSYRRFNVGDLSASGYQLNMTGPTNLGLPGIYAWEENSNTVEIEIIDLPGDGRIFVAHDVIDNGDGTWQYEYAIYNLTSDNAINGFTIPMSSNTSVLDRDFHDAPSHSGEAYKTFNWAPNIGNGYTGWKTTEYATDPDANAIRWGTMYNFSLTADTPPTEGVAELETFKNNGIATVSVRVPSAGENPFDLNGDGQVNGADAGLFFAQWGSAGPDADFNDDGIVNGADAGLLFSAWD
jgi:hypothetical protein